MWRQKVRNLYYLERKEKRLEIWVKISILIEEMYNKQVYINFTIKVLKWRNNYNFIRSKF